MTACLFTKLLWRDILVPLRKQSKRGVVAHSLCVPMVVITFPVAGNRALGRFEQDLLHTVPLCMDGMQKVFFYF